MIFGDAPAGAPAQPQQAVRTAKCDFWDQQFAKVLEAYQQGFEPSSPSLFNNMAIL